MVEKGSKDKRTHKMGVGLWPTLQYQPLYKLIRAAILRNIEQGHFKEGDILPSTRKMAGIFSVSIITIRSAVKNLQNEGILESRHGYGVVVKKSTNKGYKRGVDNIIALLGKDKRPIQKQKLKQASRKLNLREEIEELFDIRSILEEEAVRAACRRIDPETIHVLKDKITKILNQKEIKAYLGFQIDLEMHRLIVRNCPNKRLVHMIGRINEEIEIYRLIHTKEMSKKDTRDVLKGNLQILDALLKRKYNECRKLMKKHIKESKSGCLARWTEECTKERSKNGF